MRPVLQSFTANPFVNTVCHFNFDPGKGEITAIKLDLDIQQVLSDRQYVRCDLLVQW
jgi:hypothetical protein